MYFNDITGIIVLEFRYILHKHFLQNRLAEKLKCALIADMAQHEARHLRYTVPCVKLLPSCGLGLLLLHLLEIELELLTLQDVTVSTAALSRA